jgi:hypothetical protein
MTCIRPFRGLCTASLAALACSQPSPPSEPETLEVPVRDAGTAAHDAPPPVTVQLGFILFCGQEFDLDVERVECSVAHDEPVDLRPLSRLTHVRSLGIKGGRCDVAPIAGLPLTNLRLACAIQNPSVIGGLGSLQRLDLSYSNVSDIAFVAELTKLEILRLHHTPVADLGPLAQLARLVTVDVAETQVEDVSPLGGLLKLRNLSLGHTRVGSLAPLRSTRLRHVDLERTRIEDLEPIAKHPLERLRLNDTPVRTLAPISGSQTLKDLEIRGTNIASLAGIRLPRLENLSIGNRFEYVRQVDVRGGDDMEAVVDRVWLEITPPARATTSVAIASMVTQLGQFPGLRYVELKALGVVDLSSILRLQRLETVEMLGTEPRSMAPVVRRPDVRFSIMGLTRDRREALRADLLRHHQARRRHARE